MTDTQVSPFIDFYRSRDIIPAMEDIRDWLSYATQRDRLLRRLGVPPSLIKDKSVIEIGIGTGQKARHLLEHLPSMYVAVDGNP